MVQSSRKWIKSYLTNFIKKTHEFAKLKKTTCFLSETSYQPQNFIMCKYLLSDLNLLSSSIQFDPDEPFWSAHLHA